MAQLKSTVVQGSLRITDTTITNNLTVAGTTTSKYALIAPTSSDGAPTWRLITTSDISGLGTAATHAHGDYAAASHGTHVTETTVKTALGTGTGTTKFLREDGNWATPAYIANSAYGNISTGGTITSNGVTLGEGDRLLFSDSSNNGKIERSSITFGTSTSTWLRNDGSWTTPVKADFGLGSVENVAGNGRVFYGTCNTTAGTAAKVVTCASYDALTAGDLLIVKFDNINSAAGPTLNVNSKGAKNIKKLYNGAVNNLSANAEITGTCIFVYDGTQWLLSNADYNNTYSSQAAASGGTAVSLVTTGEKYTWNNKSNLVIGNASTQAMAGNTTVTNVTISANTTTNANYPLVFGTTNTGTTTTVTEGLQKSTTKFYVNPSTGNILATTFNSYTLAAACAKGVTDNSSNADVTSSDTNLITGRTLYYQLAKKGYVTSSGVTSVTLAGGAGITIDNTSAITSTGTRTISITDMNTSTGSTTKWLNQKGGWTTPTATNVGLGNVTNDAQIAKSIGTAKGDIIYFTGSSAPSRLAIGSTGLVLKVVNGAPAWSTDNNDNNAVTHTLGTTTKYYVTGTTSGSTSTGGDTFDTGVYVTTTAGQLNATTYKVNDKCTMQWNSTLYSLDFVF